MWRGLDYGGQTTRHKFGLAQVGRLGLAHDVFANRAEHFDKAAIYYTIADGFPEGFERLAWNNEVGLVYQAIFISAAEQDFIKRQGAAVFEERFKAQDADLCSLRRPSCV